MQYNIAVSVMDFYQPDENKKRDKIKEKWKEEKRGGGGEGKTKMFSENKNKNENENENKNKSNIIQQKLQNDIFRFLYVMAACRYCYDNCHYHNNYHFMGNSTANTAPLKYRCCQDTVSV